MTVSREQLERICRIPQALPGHSIRDLVDQTSYRSLRSGLTRDVIATHLASHPQLVLDWLRYSERKRTSGGWYLMHPPSGWVVGRLGGPEHERELRFGSGPDACAEFIVRELDGVAGDPAGTPRSA